MDPVTIIGGIGSLVGGLLSKPKSKYVVPDYAGIRKQAEAAGFNPLTALTQGPQGSVVTTTNPMGTAFAEAALMLGQNLSKATATAKLQQAQSANAKLQAKVQNLTLRPKVGGIYARRQSVPSLGAALGRPDAGSNQTDVAAAPVVGQAASGGPAPVGAGLTFGAPDFVDRSALTPGRETKVSPTENISGLMHIDNAITGPLSFFGADGEIFMEYVQAPLLGLPQIAKNWLGTPKVGFSLNKGLSLGVEKSMLAEKFGFGASVNPPRHRPKPVGKRPKWLPEGAYP